jgi:superfamily II DNA/RNA helicase
MEFFSRLGLAEPLATALASFGFETPTPVQIDAIPVILSRRDAIIESETGTGKTFAYLAPAFQLVSVLERKGVGEPGVIVAAPTQELAVQIGRESERLAKAASLSLTTVVLLGGTPLEKQALKLKSKPEIVVGTLGRLADLVALGKLRTGALKVLVLDEADRLFANETEELAIALLKSAPPSASRVLVSATIPERLRKAMRPLLRDAVEICPEGDTVISGDIEHWCFYCDGRKRLDFARRFEAAVKPDRCLMFLSMATRVEKAALALAALGLPIGAIHSGMDKETRRVALERFSKGELRYLLTSDLGARGLDIPGITHVLSLDLPDEPTVYTHRAGRTGRAKAKGVSIVLADGVELARASKIATKGGFVFRTKVLEEGKVLEPTTEEFFGRAQAFEAQRMAAKAAHFGDEAHRGLGLKRRDQGGGPGYERDASERRGPRPDQRTDRSPPGRDSKGRWTTRSAARSAPRGADRDDESVEGPRTARAPRSAPWRADSSGPSPVPHTMLYKKSELPDQAPEAKPLAPRGDRPSGDRPRIAPRGDRPSGDRPRIAPRGDRPSGDRPRIAPRGDKPSGDRPRIAPRGDRPSGDRPRSDAPRSAPRAAPRGDRQRREGGPETKRPPRK